MVRERFVIVGANLTGGAAAATLRQEGFEGGITLIGAEPHPPYERPPLSKEYLRGEAEGPAHMPPADWYEGNDVEPMLGVVAERLDLEGRKVVLGGGRGVPFDRLLLATGGRNRRLDVPGSQLPGVHHLRTVEEADAIRSAAAQASKAVVVGAGFIGCEVAASLREMGLEVEVVEILDMPLRRVAGPEVGAVYDAIHRDHGVTFHYEQTVERFEGAGRVQRVVTDRGDVIDCDLVVVGIGIEPSTELAVEAGTAVDNGILVDERCRTSVEGIFAAGDVANHWHPLFGRRMRVEHYDNALKQGATAARSMLGQDAVFDDPHWFWSDQYGHNLQYLGHAVEYDRLVVRGSMQDRRFVGFYVKDGVVDGVIGLDRGRDVKRAAGLVRSRRPVDLRALADEDVDVRTLGGGR